MGKSSKNWRKTYKEIKEKGLALDVYRIIKKYSRMTSYEINKYIRSYSRISEMREKLFALRKEGYIDVVWNPKRNTSVWVLTNGTAS